MDSKVTFNKKLLSFWTLKATNSCKRLGHTMAKVANALAFWYATKGLRNWCGGTRGTCAPPVFWAKVRILNLIGWLLEENNLFSLSWLKGQMFYYITQPESYRNSYFRCL